LPTLRSVSGEEVVKILCNRFGFRISGRKGSHVRLSKETPAGKVGTVVPLHGDIKIGTLHNVLALAKVSQEEFSGYL
jgi:predicted RNA binding protein YcfA (HicA-like mRNA interferase family)